ncbi:MAG: hypothetical protein Q8R39_02150 [bacterium]|nr:hypothetical protein [bacterium]MDZ4284202.1 hypothetical protein [Patescibacteria group bacterium]
MLVFANGGDAHDTASPHDAELPHVGVGTVIEEISVREGLVVHMSITTPVTTSMPLPFSFLINEKPGNTVVPFYELDVEHTRLMHVIGVRSDLNEFRHIHPEPSPDDPAVFRIEHTFDNPGEYKFWSEIARGQQHFTFGHPMFMVTGDGVESKKVISLARNVIVGDYQVALSVPQRIATGRAADLTFDVHTLVGDGIALEEYLGEPMHLVAIKGDLSQFVHAHPTEAHTHAINTLAPVAHAHGPTGDAPGYEPVNFHVAFPTAGFYKLFAQFRPQGANLDTDETLTATFWVEVKDSTLAPATGQVLLTTVSLVLMALLSVWVYRYIHRTA